MKKSIQGGGKSVNKNTDWEKVGVIYHLITGMPLVLTIQNEAGPGVD